MFDLKQRRINGAKNILNILHGALSEKKKEKKTVKPNEKFTIPSDCEYRIYKSNIIEGDHHIKYCYRDNPYKTPYARV
jgi:hypothetical protein